MARNLELEPRQEWKSMGRSLLGLSSSPRERETSYSWALMMVDVESLRLQVVMRVEKTTVHVHHRRLDKLRALRYNHHLMKSGTLLKHLVEFLEVLRLDEGHEGHKELFGNAREVELVRGVMRRLEVVREFCCQRHNQCIVTHRGQGKSTTK